MALRRIICGVAVLAGTGVALAYPVGPALSLDKLTAEADLIFKGTIGSSQQVEDDWFKPYAGFVVLETPFRVISVLKGDAPSTALRFRHYDQDPRPQGRMFEPQHYHFEKGQSYIVFAKRSDAAGFFRQLQAFHTAKEDQGAFLCPDDQPVTAKIIKEAIWVELTCTLKSPDATNVTYAIHQLDQMSARGNMRSYAGFQPNERAERHSWLNDGLQSEDRTGRDCRSWFAQPLRVGRTDHLLAGDRGDRRSARHRQDGPEDDKPRG